MPGMQFFALGLSGLNGAAIAAANGGPQTTPATPTSLGPPGGLGAKRFADLVNKHRLVNKAVSAFQARRETYRVKNEQKAVKVLGVVFVVFVIAWVPFAIANILSAVCELTTSCFIPPSVLTTLTWFGYISSSINPLIYNAINERFRFAFKQILTCQWQTLRKRQLAQTASTSSKLVAAKMIAHDMSLMQQSSATAKRCSNRSLAAVRSSTAGSQVDIMPEHAVCRRLLLSDSSQP